MKYYLILSEGAYSDYSPTYFVGDKQITQEEFEKKGKEIGDFVIDEYEKLPEREHKCDVSFCKRYHHKTEKYYPETGKVTWTGMMSVRWFDLTEKWILEQGFIRLPEKIPELNSSYNEFPNNKLTK